MPDIDIEIDGIALKAKPNSMIIQVADEAGIYIPRFCYHKHLSIAANCRMCLVEVEKSPKTLPACATPVTPGMKVFTRSPKAITAQKSVMEFLLINHPLDCPICDQGGECELQDLSMGFGSADSFYTEGKRSVKDKDLGPLISSDMTRCIQCTRCVRFGDEVAGLRELGATGRGEHMEIGTYIQHAIRSEVSGNVIDLCPVGALTSKPFRFTARAWELDQYPSIAAHDCIGTNINVHTRNGKVMRVVPRENVEVNETWISDRDRYSYEGLYHHDRLSKPLIRVNGHLQETDWQTAFERASAGINQVIQAHGADAIGALASPNSTVEEFYLLQKLIRQLGSPHIDHRLRQTDFSDQNNFPIFSSDQRSISALETYDRILLIGSNIQKEQPSAALRFRKAVLKGASVIAINPMDYAFHFNLAHKKIVAPHEMTHAIGGILKILLPDQEKLKQCETTKADQAIVDCLSSGKSVAVVLGALSFNHPDAAMIRLLATKIAEQVKGNLMFFTEGCNAAGGWLAGALPHRSLEEKNLEKVGLDAAAMLNQPRKAYLLLNVEPNLDCGNPVSAMKALQASDCTVALSVFKNSVLDKLAHVILPIAPFTETSGTYINIAGTWQSFRGIAKPYKESRPAWKVLRVLGNFLAISNFDYSSSEAVLNEIKGLLDKKTLVQSKSFQADWQAIKFSHESKLSRIGEIPIYSGDSLVRRAKALQKTQIIIEGELARVRIHPDTAKKLNLNESDRIEVKQGDQRIRLSVLLDNRVPSNAVFLWGGIVETENLPELFGAIEIAKEHTSTSPLRG